MDLTSQDLHNCQDGERLKKGEYISRDADLMGSDVTKIEKENTWQMVDILWDRLELLETQMKNDSIDYDSLIGKIVEGVSDTKEVAINYASLSDECDDGLWNLPEKVPHPLSFRNHLLLQTDAAKKVEHILHVYREEGYANHTKTKSSKPKYKRGLSRLEARRREKRKKNIIQLQSVLENNSSKYLARAANSVLFRMKRLDGDKCGNLHKQFLDKGGMEDSCEENWPIPVGGHDMNPELLIRLSCEKLTICKGRQALSSLVLHRISLRLFVFLYWFSHCRFFQVINKLGILSFVIFHQTFNFWYPMDIIDSFRARTTLSTWENCNDLPSCYNCHDFNWPSLQERFLIPTLSICSFQSNIFRVSIFVPWQS